MSEGKLMAEQARGERAAALLREPLITESFDALEEKYIDGWKNSSSTEGRETLFQMYQALMVVRGHLTEVVETGNLAKLEINNQRKFMRR
jgi:phosphoketolase|tara:strand:+ start:726 stop:995 length:270 start_codon:yes stop_codon:yes gene_type:complete